MNVRLIFDHPHTFKADSTPAPCVLVAAAALGALCSAVFTVQPRVFYYSCFILGGRLSGPVATAVINEGGKKMGIDNGNLT
jgi:hypothetical protein